MIKVYCGEDTYESYLKARLELQKLATQNNALVKTIDCDEINSISELSNELEKIDLFSSKKVYLAKRLFKNTQITKYFEEAFNGINEADIIVWEEGKLDKRLSLYKFLNKKKLVEDFSLPKPYEIEIWLKKQSEAHEISLDKEQIKHICNSLEYNKWLIASELEKIKLFLSRKNSRKIEEKELESILGFDIRGNIWSLIDAFSKRDISKLVGELNKLVEYEDNTQLIISMITRELDILFQVKASLNNKSSLEALKLHPFVLKKAVENASRFSISEISLFQEKLLDLDFSIKQGKIDSKVGLTLYFLALKNQ